MSQVFNNPGDDVEMAKASEIAQANFRFFWRELSWEYRRVIPALEMCAVKYAFKTDEAENNNSGNDDENDDEENDAVPTSELMWLSDVDFDGDEISCTLLNQPNHISSLNKDDRLQLPFGDLMDWMYVFDGRAYGGYTVQLMRSRMDADQREAHDDAWGLKFGDPKKIQLMPDEWKQAKATPGLLKKILGREINVLNEHQMAVNMLESLHETLTEKPEMASQVDNNGWTMLHSMAAAGSQSACAVLLKHNADPNAKTTLGYTAKDLADKLGWNDVVELLSN